LNYFCPKRYIIVFFILQLFLLFNYHAAEAQIANSPYSARGAGELIFSGTARDFAMGGIGQVNGSPLYDNIQNPALIQNNKLTNFGIAFSLERKYLYSPTGSQRDIGAGLFYSQLCLPITKKWSSAIGLRPYAVTQYTSGANKMIAGSQVPVFEKGFGEGGFTKLYWTNGIGIGKKDKLKVGLEIAYLFGTVSQHYTSQIDNINQNIVARIDRTSIGDFRFKTGISYTDTLKGQMLYNIGASFELQQKLSVTQISSVEKQTAASVPSYGTDTIPGVNQNTNITLPATLNIGFGVEQRFKYVLGVEFGYGEWSKYKHPVRTETLKDTWSVRIGGEYTPDYQSVSNYLKRVTYRAGFSHEKLSWSFDGTQLSETAISGGLVFPSQNFASFNITASYGRRGFNLTDGIKEEFFRIYLGLIMNDRWFQRRKYN
jgi:hypothetical protein